jgi:hypothetical protein
LTYVFVLKDRAISANGGCTWMLHKSDVVMGDCLLRWVAAC